MSKSFAPRLQAYEDQMAYLVLAAGAVMVLIGAMAIVTGYPIIQVERGWATVIAGTSLLAGGIVTIALGLVLRVLMDLRLALVTPEVGRGALERTAGTQPADRSMEPLFASRDEPMSDPYHDQAMLGAAAVAMPAAALAPRETETHAVETHPLDEAAQEHLAQEHVAHEHVAPEHVAQASGSQAPDSQAYDLQAGDGHVASEPPSDEQAHDVEPHKPSAPRLDDWLDRAFADLHEPALPVHADDAAARPVAPDPLYTDHPGIDHATTAADPPVEHAPATQVHDDHLEAHAHAHEPRPHEHSQDAHADAAPAVPAASEPTSAVIGRYEADGTFYTMYADGSIDAQSDVSLYRFASMAELKAFIEG